MVKKILKIVALLLLFIFCVMHFPIVTGKEKVAGVYICPNKKCNYSSTQSSRSGKCPLCGTKIVKDRSGRDLASLPRWKVDEDQIEEAIDAGVAYLMSVYEEAGYDKPLETSPGRWSDALTGYIPVEKEAVAPSLVLYTLIHCGFSEDEPLIQEGMEYLTQTPLEKMSFHEALAFHIYSVPLAIMALEALDRVAYHERIVELAQFIVDSQNKNGGWGYPRPNPAKKVVRRRVRKKKQITAVGSGFTLEGTKIKKRTVIQKSDSARPGLEPNTSSVHFALLGLRAAERSGAVIPQSTWKAAKKYLMYMQARDGGWGYVAPGRSYGSMTLASICSLIICKYYLKEDYKDDPSIKKGLNWIARYFTVRENPRSITSYYGMCGPNVWYLYYLYTIERVGTIGGWDSFGGVEWYPTVAQRLLFLQDEDGYWNSWGLRRVADKEKKVSAEYTWGHPVVDTCLALLCLQKASIVLPPPAMPTFEEGIEEEEEEEEEEYEEEYEDDEEDY